MVADIEDNRWQPTRYRRRIFDMKIVPRIRNAARETGKIVGILMDTQGPAIRTGDLPAKLNLKPGDIFEFTVRGEKSEENRLTVPRRSR